MNISIHRALTLSLLLPLLHACSDRDDAKPAPDPQDAMTQPESPVPPPETAAPPAVAPPATPAPDAPSPSAQLLGAVARLLPSDNGSGGGLVTFTQSDQGFAITGQVTGLSPGEHGMFIYEGGNCDEPGAHFAPTGNAHGSPAQPEHHLGDLGNITADAGGNAALALMPDDLELQGPNSIVGRVLVIHSGADDYTTQPSGDAGDIAACAVIEPDESAGPGSPPAPPAEAPPNQG